MKKQEFIDQRLDNLTTRITAITDELRALPVLSKDQRVEEECVEENTPDPVVNEVIKEKTLKKPTGSGRQRGGSAKAVRKESPSDDND